MPTEPTLRSLFADDGEPVAPIDTSRVIRRSRARRRPAQLVVGGVATLAVVGIAAIGVQSLQPSFMTATSTSSESGLADENSLFSDEDLSADDVSPADLKRAPADRLNLCGGPLAEVAPSATGLVLTASFPEAVAGAARVDGTVTMTNTGTARVSGFTAGSPAITLSSDGIVLWHSNGPTTMVAVTVDLEPGESLDYPASFAPVACGVEDDAAEAFRDDLPSVPAGVYTVTAAVDLQSDGPVELVTGPPAEVVLR